MKTLVIIVTIIGLFAVIGSVIVGMMVFEGKVVDKPYETGLRYDELEKAKEELRFELLNTDFHVGSNDIIFILKDNLDKAITDSQLTLILSRPSTGLYDSEYKVDLIEPGRYRAKVNIPLKGHWDVKIRFLYKGQNLDLEKHIYAMP